MNIDISFSIFVQLEQTKFATVAQKVLGQCTRPYKHCLKCQNWASSGLLRVAAGQSWPGSGT